MEEVLDKEETQAVPVVEETEDPSIAAVIALPGYDAMTDQKVIKSVKSLFNGFEYDADAGGRFETTEQLATYTQNTMEDIKRVRKSSEATDLVNKAAIMARFWYLGSTINDALVKGNYGTGAVNKLATALRKSIPYIYQIRAVATKLTAVDCYLLGMRGLDSTHLRKLAQVKDDSVRSGIISAFIEAYSDTSDPSKIDKAKKQLVSAVNANQNISAEELGTSDPLNGGTDVLVSDEWHAAMRAMNEWTRMLKKPSSEAPTDALCNALADFYLKETVPDAEERLAEIKECAVALKALMQAVTNNLADAIKELDGLEDVELTSVPHETP